MTKRHLFSAVVLTFVFFLSIGGCRENKASRALELYDLKNGQTLTGDQVLRAVQGARLVLVGEHHTTESHHRDQLRIIRFLKESDVALSIGMEMFRKDQQEALDRWVAGDISEAEFRPIYLDNWNFPWELYRDIFVYARDNKIPMVGLNVSRGITRQVASQGFASLSDQQRGELEGVVHRHEVEHRELQKRIELQKHRFNELTEVAKRLNNIGEIDRAREMLELAFEALEEQQFLMQLREVPPHEWPFVELEGDLHALYEHLEHAEDYRDNGMTAHVLRDLIENIESHLEEQRLEEAFELMEKAWVVVEYGIGQEEQ